MSHDALLTAVYPGSFDPFTLGHMNIVERASRLFDRLIIGVGVNREKRPWFTAEQRVGQVRSSIAHLPNISVRIYEGLTVSCSSAAPGSWCAACVRSRISRLK